MSIIVDTYENARTLTEEQIEKENVVHAEHDAIESQVLDLWNEYLEVPYGKFTLRIRADLTTTDFNEFNKLAQLGENASDQDTARMISILSLGIYSGDEKIHDAGAEYWADTRHWGVLLSTKIFNTFFNKFKAEMDAVNSFRGNQT